MTYNPLGSRVRMKKRVKQGRSMIVIGLLLLLGSALFREIPGIDWTLSAVVVFSAFGLLVVGLLFARQ